MENPADPSAVCNEKTFLIQRNPVGLEPRMPTSVDAVQLTIADQWRDGCLPEITEISRNGSAIRIDTAVPPPPDENTFCQFVVTPYTLATTFEPFPAGRYTARAFVTERQGTRELGSVAFDVENPLPIVSGLRPTRAPVGGESFTLGIKGQGFLDVDRGFGERVPCAGSANRRGRRVAWTS